MVFQKKNNQFNSQLNNITFPQDNQHAFTGWITKRESEDQEEWLRKMCVKTSMNCGKRRTLLEDHEK